MWGLGMGWDGMGWDGMGYDGTGREGIGHRYSKSTFDANKIINTDTSNSHHANNASCVPECIGTYAGAPLNQYQ